MPACLHFAAGGDVLDFQLGEVTSAKLAVDGETEEREISNTLLELKSGADRPDLFYLKCRFLAPQLSAGNATLPLFRADGCFSNDLHSPTRTIRAGSSCYAVGRMAAMRGMSQSGK